ncbi:cyclic nucleotide-binding domain-containing protein 1 [Pteropus medius]|uniref:cyclic nucleotide-binding domain-containing protein 1 n=1 Tax=Pteropus vampyrus TaxID=132908 RepID=UPI00196B84A0|nr:cyclic nucleotide-binding domain-containing protein 1 [Pteropus giganteus]
MPMSSLSSAILSHMIAINNVPPPPLRSVPGLKMSTHIDYGQLNALCNRSGQQSCGSACSVLSAHTRFMKQYPKIFLKKKVRLPKLFKQEGKREPKGTEESQPQQSDAESHNIAVYVKKARGGHTLYGPKKYEEKLEEFLAILKKLPMRRTLHEHKMVWKMLKTIPDLTSQLTDEDLKALSKSVTSETWVKGSTVVGNDGFYVILKGLARPQTQVYKNLLEESESTATFIPQSFHSFVFSDNLENVVLAEMHTPPCDPMLRPWSTFGTLEVSAQFQLEPREFSVVTEEDCEILKIPAKDYAKIKLEKTKFENKQIVNLIRKCPYYVEWPTLSIHELVLLIRWRKFPPGHVIVESGNIISFVAFINSGYCNIYKPIVGLVKLQSKKVKKIRKLVYMGKVKEMESFGEISVLLRVPFTCTVVTGNEVEMAVIEDKDLFGLDPVTQQLMLQTAKPTFGHLTDEDVKNEYLQKEQQKEWNNFKRMRQGRVDPPSAFLLNPVGEHTAVHSL